MRSSVCSLDASPITPQISQGSKPPEGPEVHRCGFSVLVLAAQEFQPPRSRFRGISVLHAPLDDAELTTREWLIANDAAATAAAAVLGGHHVLITCHMGLNRSGLITALVLRKAYNLSGVEAVRRVKRKREGALCNPSFVEALVTLPA
jgi:protein-tyrosine phosphatase